MNWLRWSIACAILLGQVAAIVYARYVPSRYFCWAPYDMQTQYRLHVTVNGKELTAEQVRRRYRRARRGSDNRSPRHLMDILQQAEERYHARDPAEIVMHYSVNGRAEQVWQWPPAP